MGNQSATGKFGGTMYKYITPRCLAGQKDIRQAKSFIEIKKNIREYEQHLEIEQDMLHEVIGDAVTDSQRTKNTSIRKT